MILKLTKYTNTPGTFEAEWLDDDKTVRVIAYSGDQIDLFRADVAQYGGEVDEALLAEVQAEWVPPLPEPPAPPTQFTSLQFLDLFTEAEQLAVATAAMHSAQVKLWYDRTLAATFISLADPRTEAGLDALVTAGLLTVERKAAIVEAMQ